MFSLKAKAQSALEYMTTYGWAIVIIAVVLGALFQLGIFNASSLSPKVQAGSCSVTRLATGGQVLSSLSGNCNNGLPQFVATLSLGGSNVVLPNPTIAQTSASAFTASFWLFVPTGTTSAAAFPQIFESSTGNVLVYFGVTGGKPNGVMQWRVNGVSYVALTYSLGSWNHVVVEFSSPTSSGYINDVSQGTATNTNSISSYPTFYLGSIPGASNPTFPGTTVADLQVYNTSLSAADVKTLYQEGIGGDPIDLQYLVGWWPLNGNANDYSGLNSNGQPFNGIAYNSSWSASYKAPYIP